jgi:hypothetical protein
MVPDPSPSALFPSVLQPARPPVATLPFSSDRPCAAAILHYLSQAVLTSSDALIAVQHLHLHRVGSMLRSLAQGYAESSSTAGCGQYEAIIYCHLGAILRDRPIVTAMLDLALSEGEDRLWTEYAQGLQSLWLGQPYHRRIGTTHSGLDRYWCVYLDLLETLCCNGSIPAILSKATQAFADRNHDPCISQDWYGVEGSPRQKVLWDFRRDAIFEMLTLRPQID